MFHLERMERIFEAISQSMSTTFFNRHYQQVRKKEMESFESHVVGGERRDGSKDLFVTFV